MAKNSPPHPRFDPDGWKAPLLTQRNGLPEGGRIGALKGCWVDHRLVEEPRTATEAINRRRDAQAPRSRGDSLPEPRSDARTDAGEIEVVIDGVRHCEDPTTGRWRPCAELGEGEP